MSLLTLDLVEQLWRRLSKFGECFFANHPILANSPRTLKFVDCVSVGLFWSIVYFTGIHTKVLKNYLNALRCAFPARYRANGQPTVLRKSLRSTNICSKEYSQRLRFTPLSLTRCNSPNHFRLRLLSILSRQPSRDIRYLRQRGFLSACDQRQDEAYR